MFDREPKFIPPWEKYKKVARLVSQGRVEQALKRKELSWLQGDIDSWVSQAMDRPGDFDSAQVRFMDALAGTDVDESSVEARVFQRWSGYPQIGAMLSATGLSRSDMLSYISSRIEAYNAKGKTE